MTLEGKRLREHNTQRAAKCRAFADKMFNEDIHICPHDIAIIRDLQQQLYNDADALEFSIRWIR